MRHHPRALAVVLLGALCTALPARAQEAPAGDYAIDKSHASFYFAIKHLDLADIYGRFNEFEGSVTLGDAPRFEATLQTASIDTGVQRRDDHLRSPDFFDARQFPTVTFQSTQVEIDGETYQVTGDLSMHGETREVTLELKFNGAAEFRGQQRVGFSGGTTIDRREWGIDGFPGVVGNEVTLILSFEAVRQ